MIDKNTFNIFEPVKKRDKALYSTKRERNFDESPLL